MTRQANQRLSSVRGLRAMAHPLRVRLYSALYAEHSATASHLGDLVGESPALVSYHLHQLAKNGLVREVARPDGDRRQRWWEVTSEGFSFALPEAGGPDDVPQARAAVRALQRAALSHQVSRLEEFRDQEPSWGTTWSQAAFSSDALLRLTPAQTTQLRAELQEVIARWHGQSQQAAAFGHEAHHSHEPDGARSTPPDPTPPPSGHVDRLAPEGSAGNNAEAAGAAQPTEPADERRAEHQAELVMVILHGFPTTP